jgi:hypothetical protein
MKSSVFVPGIVVGLLVVGSCDAAGQTPYPRAGWETHFTQLGHGVRGTATILDERTIRLTHFSYDGLAPDMYVYLATNLTSAAFRNSGLTASPRLARAYTNETYLVQLPVGQTLNGWNAISIWCRAVQGSFGWGTFAPSVRPTLTATRLPNAVEVKLTGEAGQKYWLAGSTNLLDTNAWQTIALLTNTTGTVRYTNSPVNQHSARFFRSVRD